MVKFTLVGEKIAFSFKSEAMAVCFDKTLKCYVMNLKPVG